VGVSRVTTAGSQLRLDSSGGGQVVAFNVTVHSSFDFVTLVSVEYGVSGKPRQMRCRQLSVLPLGGGLDMSRVRCVVNRGLGAGLMFSLW
jgi:hypothetical protein